MTHRTPIVNLLITETPMVEDAVLLSLDSRGFAHKSTFCADSSNITRTGYRRACSSI